MNGVLAAQQTSPTGQVDLDHQYSGCDWYSAYDEENVEGRCHCSVGPAEYELD